MGKKSRYALRLAAAGIVCVVAAWLLVRYCYQPYRCNQEKKRIELFTRRAVEGGLPAVFVSRQARANMEFADRCLRVAPTDVDLLMEKAASLRLLGRYDDAAQAYRRALLIDQRPEIYFNLGEVNVQAGKNSEAIEAFLVAARFERSWAGRIDPKGVAEEVIRRLDREASPR